VDKDLSVFLSNCVGESEDGDEKVERVSEISWTGGNIPAGQRDEFLFSAQAPASSTTIPWKAYQTYADGSVVAWDASAKAVADQKKVMDEAMKKDPNMACLPSFVTGSFLTSIFQPGFTFGVT
jgi:hypothetical protein